MSTDINGKVEEELVIDRRNELSARCNWTITEIKGKIKQRAVWSKYFDVGGYDCRLLLYPSGEQISYLRLCMQLVRALAN